MLIADEDGYGLNNVASELQLKPESVERLSALVETLDKWIKTHNLIGPKERARLWRRHILDSAQIWSHVDRGAPANWVDLGSGAGFPALVLAATDSMQAHKFTLVESNGKKCSYLRAAGRAANLNIDVKNARIEDVSRETYGYVTSRALADLPRLLGHAYSLLAKKASCVFLKGKEIEAEIEASKAEWDFEYELYPSLSHPDGRIIVIRNLQRRTL